MLANNSTDWNQCTFLLINENKLNLFFLCSLILLLVDQYWVGFFLNFWLLTLVLLQIRFKNGYVLKYGCYCNDHITNPIQ